MKISLKKEFWPMYIAIIGVIIAQFNSVLGIFICGLAIGFEGYKLINIIKNKAK